jgi:hypothetical protein
MRGYQMTTAIGRVAGLGGLGALVFTYACGGSQAPVGTRASFAQDAAAPQAGAPVMVTCEPNQRTLVRPVLVNGTAVSQVECVSSGQAYASADPAPAQPIATPVQYRYNAPRPVQAVRDVYEDRQLADTRVIPVSSDPARTAARPVRAEQVVYDDRPVRRTPVRSVKKSAVIIGSSAGAGAGVGAAIGGKKGALIGAVIGGGGATLWDQVTRRRN